MIFSKKDSLLLWHICFQCDAIHTARNLQISVCTKAQVFWQLVMCSLILQWKPPDKIHSLVKVGYHLALLLNYPQYLTECLDLVYELVNLEGFLHAIRYMQICYPHIFT